MDLRRLKYFVAVAEELHFRRAAERLGIQQPPLSLQIRKLETEIGTPLLRRKGHLVQLTPAGKLLLEQARDILARTEHAKAEVRRRGRGESGQVYVGFAGATMYPSFLYAAIKDYRAQYPDVFLSPEQSTTGHLMAGLRSGRIDIAFLRAPSSERDDISFVPLLTEPTYIVLPPGHAQAMSNGLRLGGLADDTLIMFPREMSPAYYDEILAACRSSGFEPKLGPEASQISTCLAMVAAGFGFAFMVKSVVDRVRPDDVVYVPILEHRPNAIIGMAYRRGEAWTAVRNLIARIRKSAEDSAMRHPAP